MQNLLKYSLFLLGIVLGITSCNAQQQEKDNTKTAAVPDSSAKAVAHHNVFDTSVSTIHIFVALCDNKYQGIVPVPKGIGNGQDPDHNLYWGCAFGIRSYFKNSREWQLLSTEKVDSIRLERLVFKHRTRPFYLVADAYDGQYIAQCTQDFLNSTAGRKKDTLQIKHTTIGLEGNARLLAYIGHDGLMDFRLTGSFENTDGRERDCMILACISKKYFAPHVKAAKANPLLWTTGLMAPEAYIVHDAITGYINRETNDQIKNRAARAYARFQKCSLKAAGNLLVSGW